MTTLQELFDSYGKIDCRDLGSRQLELLRDGLRQVSADEIKSCSDGKLYIDLLRKFREAVAENDKLHGENYPQLLNSLLSVGEDGLYSNSLRFIFELIQNVDDCDFNTPDDCKLDMRFDFNKNEIVLTYNEVGFTPFNVFAITGIAEAAKNVSASKNEIGEKGIGFKSVFGVADRVLIRSGWFSFELYKDNFTIPFSAYREEQYCPGTQMTLFVPERARLIYRQIRDQYCRKEALFRKNPLLFLNKLTSLKLYYDAWRSMEFRVSRTGIPNNVKIYREDNVKIAVDLHDSDNGLDRDTVEEIACIRYSYPVTYSQEACQSRYGEKTLVGSQGGKRMLIQAVVPHVEYVDKVGKGGLYSFLPTQLNLTVPVVCHAPFKLDASREFVDPQDKDIDGGNLWFIETARYLSELMDYVFSDLAKTVKQDIVYYLPSQRGSLFASNNGKEECLRRQNVFRGSHYLALPIFETVEGEFKQASEIFCFDPSEKIRDQVKVAKWLDMPKKLFLIQENVTVDPFEITVEKDINNRLFQKALTNSQYTREIFEYLNSAGYEFSEKQFPKDKDFAFTGEQIECIMGQKSLAEIVLNVAYDAVRRSSRPRFSVAGENLISVFDVLFDGFDLSETPRLVEQYMNYCEKACCCLNITDGMYLPCYNGIVLSARNPLSSFAAFCSRMEPRDTFAMRIKFREASKRLNQLVENNTGSATDFIRELRNIRLTVKDSLGDNGYKSYLKLILQSGTDRTRFVQELLQNADDCTYPKGEVPSFILRQSGGKIVTEYNEIGFTRLNIRSITAIGESTKNRLAMGDYRAIGEKGVGFKTIFAVASEVKIHSGEYDFSLRDEEPTIPRPLTGVKEHARGTRMEIILKDDSVPSTLKAESILELCLCLRQLRELDINGHKVLISDVNKRRTITIDNRSYVYSKYVHSFIVEDERAIEERGNGMRKIDPNQQIICYVPERSSTTDFPLYVGLPTKHRVRIPMIIDAPFELTTSREQIEIDCASWNGIVKEEMYNAIVEVIHSRKSEERANALRFARFRYQISGNQRMYVNDISDSQYLNGYDYLNRLRSERVLPTFANDMFVSANERTACKYPEATMILLSKLTVANYGELKPDCVLDLRVEGASKDQKDRIDAIFNAIACETASFNAVFPLLQRNAEDFINDQDFRNCLYEYLQEAPEGFRVHLRNMKIVPVYGQNGGTQYTSWSNGDIFVKEGAQTSNKSYWILNEKLLPKSVCEKMLGVNINEMNSEWERTRYNSDLQELIQGSDITSIYDYLITEFANGSLVKYNCLGTILQLKGSVPLKNELGEITDTELFICDQPRGYFSVKMLQHITVHKECEGFARFIQCRNLSDIYYEDTDYYEELTADDVEALIDDYFNHQEEILRGFYRDGFLSDELLELYDLEYLSVINTGNNMSFMFPEQCVGNKDQLKSHVRKLFENPIKVITERVEHSVQKIQYKNGQKFDLDYNDAREGALRIYTPEGEHNICFCQMCRSVKPYRLLEVNNIELKPQLYFPQLRIALCLECSKAFEYLRNNQSKREAFISSIKNADTSVAGKVDVPIGEKTITFTAKHLAEIQEILMGMP